ncbi:MAG: vWA domain-containing protein [Pirellulales bacterium]
MTPDPLTGAPLSPARPNAAAAGNRPHIPAARPAAATSAGAPPHSPPPSRSTAPPQPTSTARPPTPAKSERELDDVELDEDDLEEEEEGEEYQEESSWTSDFWRACGASVTSMVVNAAGLVALALATVSEPLKLVDRVIVVNPITERPPDDLLKTELDDIIEAATRPDVTTSYSTPAVGVSDASTPGVVGGSAGGDISAPVLDKGVMEQASDTGLTIEGLIDDAPSTQRLIAQAPEGAIGDARQIVENYQQAMDRITQEILWMLSKGEVLVVWCFDQSESMKDDQKEIRDRIDRVYVELGLANGKDNRSLLTSITSYGAGFMNHTPKPTGDFLEIRSAIDQVPVDPSGKEMMCQAVGRSIAQVRELVQRERRQMALVLVTDESGERESNERFLEQAIAEAKAAHCRIYVLGREAVFGYPYAHMRWQHPQTKRIHWLPIDRGPETGFVEQLQIDGLRRRHDAHPAGFGSYEQTRMARETGGVFFLLPSVETNLVRGEKQKYELEAMRPYIPDLRSRLEVFRDRDDSPLRTTIWQVIEGLNPYNPQISKAVEMRIHFSPRPEEFIRQAIESQAHARAYLPYLARAQKEIEKIKHLREQEASPRWQANYDLIYAQLIAYQARIYEYGAYLEWFMKNPKVVPLTKAPNLTLVHWDIHTRKEILRPEESQPYIEKADELFEAVIHDHPGTPWAKRAADERARGYGIELVPDYEPPYPQPSGPLIPIPKY